MKINKIQIKNIIKEELQSLLDEFKAPDTIQNIPNPEDMGFKVPEVDIQMISKLKKTIIDSGLLDFVKNNFPFESLQTIEDLKESKEEKSYLKAGETIDVYEIVRENVVIMKSNRTWQSNFYTNIQKLKAKLDDLPTRKESQKTYTEYYEQRDFLEEWIKVFEVELAKSWMDRNRATIEKFAKDNIQKLPVFMKDLSEPKPKNKAELEKYYKQQIKKIKRTRWILSIGTSAYLGVISWFLVVRSFEFVVAVALMSFIVLLSSESKSISDLEDALDQNKEEY